MRCCARCGIEQTHENTTRDKRAKNGLRSICKECAGKERKGLKTYYREHHLMSKYGISEVEYEEMAAAQDHRCRICKIESKYVEYGKLAVDHDHDTGEVRGLLCKKCNQAIGLLQDRSDFCEAAGTYLKEYGK